MSEENNAQAHLEAREAMANVTDEKSAKPTSRRCSRTRFRRDYMTATHLHDDRPGAKEQRARHEYAVALVNSVYERGVEAGKIETPAQLEARGAHA